MVIDDFEQLSVLSKNQQAPFGKILQKNKT